ncbi:MAG: hypothetical protein ACREXS_17585 [Gammaproteobacteria bacterium]
MLEFYPRTDQIINKRLPVASKLLFCCHRYLLRLVSAGIGHVRVGFTGHEHEYPVTDLDFAARDLNTAVATQYLSYFRDC